MTRPDSDGQDCEPKSKSAAEIMADAGVQNMLEGRQLGLNLESCGSSDHSGDDGFDPVWGTTSNAEEVKMAIDHVRTIIGDHIGSPPRYILDVVRENNYDYKPITLSVRQLRIIRYALSVALGYEEI